MKKMLLIMNPCAGKRKALKKFTEIISIFIRGGYQVEVHVTQSRGDAKEVVAQRAKEKDLVVCCGGDGTFNETVSGLLESGMDIPVGYIPAGSTNDFANSLHLPTKILDAAQQIVDGEPVAYDLGSFGGRYFSYVASFGAFTKTSYATSQSVKNMLGHMAYLLSGISEIAHIHKIPMRLELDGDRVIEDNFIFGAVCNSTSVGGVLTLKPSQVDMCDGEFELLLVRAPKNLAELTRCIRAIRKKEYNCEMITFCKAKQVRFFADKDMPWTLDGEKEEGHETALVENMHLAFRLMKGQNKK